MPYHIVHTTNTQINATDWENYRDRQRLKRNKKLRFTCWKSACTINWHTNFDAILRHSVRSKHSLLSSFNNKRKKNITEIEDCRCKEMACLNRSRDLCLCIKRGEKRWLGLNWMKETEYLVWMNCSIHSAEITEITFNYLNGAVFVCVCTHVINLL